MALVRKRICLYNDHITCLGLVVGGDVAGQQRSKNRYEIGSVVHGLRELLFQARVVRPRLAELGVHPRLLEHLVHIYPQGSPSVSFPEGSDRPDSEALKIHLLVNPLLVTRTDDGRWSILAGLQSFYMARILLGNSDRMTALAVSSPAEAQIDYIFSQEYLLGPIMNQAVNDKNMVWESKQYLEQVGILKNVGLAGHSKQTWAAWLGCDPRTLRGKEKG